MVTVQRSKSLTRRGQPSREATGVHQKYFCVIVASGCVGLDSVTPTTISGWFGRHLYRIAALIFRGVGAEVSEDRIRTMLISPPLVSVSKRGLSEHLSK